MRNVRIMVESPQFPLTEVSPVHSGKYTYSRESGKVYYTHKPEDKIRFRLSDYQLLEIMEDFECEEVMIYVERLCSGVWVPYWSGFFTWFNTTEDKDQCWIEVEPEVNDNYKCYDQAAKDDVGLFSLPVVATSLTAGDYETKTCFESFDPVVDDVPDENESDNSCLTSTVGGVDAWCLKSISVEYFSEYDRDTDEETEEYTRRSTWHRETAPGSCNGTTVEPPSFGDPNGWELLSGGCEPADDPPVFWRCPGAIIGPYLKGRLLNDAIVRVVNESCPDLTVKSDFFGINALNDSPDNIAYTFAADNLQSVTIHQKSDVKRTDGTNTALAPAWVTNAENIIGDLTKMFNVFYVIENGVFILEHISFFTTMPGLDLTAAPKKRIFTFDTANITRREKFFWMDRDYTGPFQSQDIFNDCGEGEKEISLSLFTTDAEYIEKPANAEKISDEGFVMIANAEVGGAYYPIQGNEPLKWVNLHANLHLHGRAYRSGTINNTPVNFLSYNRYKKLEKFKATVCCSDDFSPDNEPIVSGKSATVKSATEDLVAGKIEFELTF